MKIYCLFFYSTDGCTYGYNIFMGAYSTKDEAETALMKEVTTLPIEMSNKIEDFFIDEVILGERDVI